jgi:transposase
VADRGYDAMALVERIEARGAEAHIPTQRDRKVQRSVDRAIYRQRNLVERYFNKAQTLPPYRDAFRETRRHILLSRGTRIGQKLDKSL